MDQFCPDTREPQDEDELGMPPLIVAPVAAAASPWMLLRFDIVPREVLSGCRRAARRPAPHQHATRTLKAAVRALLSPGWGLPARLAPLRRATAMERGGGGVVSDTHNRLGRRVLRPLRARERCNVLAVWSGSRRQHGGLLSRATSFPPAQHPASPLPAASRRARSTSSLATQLGKGSGTDGRVLFAARAAPRRTPRSRRRASRRRGVGGRIRRVLGGLGGRGGGGRIVHRLQLVPLECPLLEQDLACVGGMVQRGVCPASPRSTASPRSVAPPRSLAAASSSATPSQSPSASPPVSCEPTASWLVSVASRRSVPARPRGTGGGCDAGIVGRTSRVLPCWCPRACWVHDSPRLLGRV